jgi:hypothetical protein
VYISQHIADQFAQLKNPLYVASQDNLSRLRMSGQLLQAISA